MQDDFIIKNSMAALRLETLVRIRWLAVFGQSIAVVFVYFIMEFDFLILPCFGFIALSALLNVFLRYRYPGNIRWEGFQVTALLGYDIMQLALLLYLTGGLQNPFSALLAVPVVISAATQRVQNTITVFVWAIGAASLLVFFHEPLPWHAGSSFSLPLELKVGIWAAIVAMMGFTSVYTFRVADESRQLSKALAATELVLQGEQHISNLDGLATAAAHELGTPLATIALVSKEMLREISKGSNLHDDAVLLQSQAERCREILLKISSLSSAADENIARMSISVLMEEVVAPHRDFDVVLKVREAGEPPKPSLYRNAAILYGLGNILENAVDFADKEVTFLTEWDDKNIVFTIEDDGEGFQPDMLDRIGDPYVTSRGETVRETGGGLGLGVFIAKTLLERSGAILSFSNKTAEQDSGASVKIAWKRDEFERASNSTIG